VGRPRSRTRVELWRSWIGPQIEAERAAAVERASSHNEDLDGAGEPHDHTGIPSAARQGRRDLRRPPVEQVHEVGERASDLVAPQHRPAIGLGEREANADLPLQDVPNVERIADFDWIQVGTANGEACAARTDEETAKPRQFEDELVYQTIRKKNGPGGHQ
jgi:hypothetical protein